ncbi:Gfo/Idh/MocA family protein [Paenibacillus sp. SYP-B4298]|uniref:Gfo/Idh/MocA family protein n=1 Tax=Paenibacillus sp. SYP-B4298 TaxID=2996034 RepID=UPI0022DD7A92|nr:Gfo/Idh/MocA family oxidoreductase [Paenibacillus sp. SYP-B4298]
MRKVKAGIIGAGFIGKAHIEAIRRLGYAEVAAVAQGDAERAAQCAAELDIPIAYGDYRELLRNEEIEVIHNCTPNHLHYEINKQALLHGKHLLSEKPLTLRSAEAKELSELAEQRGLVTGINFNYRQFPMVQQLKSMIREGELGSLHQIRGSYLQDWLLYKTDYNWRMEEKYGGGTRAISDIGSHLFDLAQYVSGLAIVEVMADISTVHKQRYKPVGAVHSPQTAAGERELVEVNTEDCCSVLVRFGNGCRGVFTVSQVSAGNKNALELHVDGAVASGSWRQEEPFLLHMGYRDKPREKVARDPDLLKHEVQPYLHYPSGHEEGWPDSLKNMMRHVYSAVRNKRPLADSVATFRQGYEIMRINDAIVRSMERGGWESI